MSPVAEEQFDVVDAADSVLHQMSRCEVHRLGLRHRAVHIFLFRSDHRMLIHLRTAAKVEFPSVWTSSASGHVSAGETYTETAPRELFEELGIQTELQPVRKFDACAETSNEFTWLFTGASDDRVTADPEEIAEIRWMTIDEICRDVESSPDSFSPAFRLLFRSYLNDHPRT